MMFEDSVSIRMKGKDFKISGKTTDLKVSKSKEPITSKGEDDPTREVKIMLSRNKNGDFKGSIENYVIILEKDPVFKGKLVYNELLCRPAYIDQLPWREEGKTKGDWTDFDEANALGYIEKQYNLSRTVAYNKAFIIVTKKNPHNPFKAFLEECAAEWDGKKRVATFLQNHFGINGNDKYYSAVLQNYMFGIISRSVYWPGCKYDYVPVLIGKQGIGKSTFFESLAGCEEFFTDSLCELKGKDAYIQIQGKIIAEMGELTTFKKSDQDQLKAYITSKSDYFRTPYDRYAEEHPRRIVFAGTTNRENFLIDRTGNRRFLPINLMEIEGKKCGIDPAIVKQLWGEAFTSYKAAGYNEKKPNLKLDDEIEEIALQMQMDHLEEDSWVASIEAYLAEKPAGYTVSTMELYLDAVEMTGKPTKPESSRIIAVMNDEMPGWENIGRKRDKNHGNMRVQTWRRLHPQIEMNDSHQ